MAVFCFFFAFKNPAHSQGLSQADPNAEVQQGLQVIEEPLGLPSTDIRLIIANIIRVALGLIGIVLVVIIIYGGYLWMTAGGNEEQIAKAKKVLINAVIGLIIILSAYAIVWFIMRMLGVGVGPGAGAGYGPPGIQNFRGSGALGRIVKDHYPNRNQVNVPRNTKIVVTFFKPIRVDNLADGSKGDPTKTGDCTLPLNSWEDDCDGLIMDAGTIMVERIIPATTTTGTPTFEPIRGAAFLAQRTIDPATQIEGYYTIVIRPYDYLGSSEENVGYRVHLGNNIKRDDADANYPGIFANNSGSKYYEWIFTCGTELDLSPPYVIDVYPVAPDVEYKNTVIQVNFNEAMDPIGVQGVFMTSTYGYYELRDGFIFLRSGESTVPLGSFNIVNNYHSLEFTPSIPCGKNACGGIIYCLPVCDKPGATCAQDTYDMMLRAATTVSTSTFESQPFTGVADICGNALDANKDGVVDQVTKAEPLFDVQTKPDNYSWFFQIKDEMDLTPPIIAKTIPGPEAPFVAAQEDWSMWFNKRMRIDPMYYIDISESPTPQERCDAYDLTGDDCILDLIWKVPFVTFTTYTPKTRTAENHGPFLDGLPQGYIPFISSVVEDAHFNCLYPGQGPLEGDDYDVSKISSYCQAQAGDEDSFEQCCLASGASQVFCCNASPFVNSSTVCADTLLMPPPSI